MLWKTHCENKNLENFHPNQGFHILQHILKQFHLKLLVNYSPIVFVTSNKPIDTYLGWQLDPKKFITKTNISCTPFDIHKSKFVVIEIQFVNFGKTYTCSVFSTKLGNIYFLICFLEGNTTLEHKHLNHTLSTNCNGKLFFTIKKPKSFCYTSSFLKGCFTTKRKRNCTC